MITPVPSSPGSKSGNALPQDILAGSYELARNIAVLSVIELRNAVIPPGQTRQVCGNTPFNKPGEEICIDFTAAGGNNESLTITPSFFNAEIVSLACRSLTNGDGFNASPRENADFTKLSINCVCSAIA